MALNVLIVDDSVVMRTMLKRCLAMAELNLGELCEASNGHEALGVLERHWIDVVIADINMPVMNGEELIGRMRELPEHAKTPVIVVSTEGSQTRIERLENKGVTFIRKPFRPEAIRDVMTCVTQGSPPTDLPRLLREVAEQTFNELAFTFPRDQAEAVASNGVPNFEVEASVQFNGIFAGRLVLTTGRAAMAMVAANMLGLMDGERASADEQQDALKELVSVVCGNLLPAVAGTQMVFSLHSQALHPVAGGLAFVGAPPAVASVDLDLECGLVRLTYCAEHRDIHATAASAGAIA